MGAGKLQAVTDNSLSPKTFENSNSASELTEQIPSTDKLENLKPDILSRNGNLASELTEQIPSANKLENLEPDILSRNKNSASELTEQFPSANKLENLSPNTLSSLEGSSVELHYPSKPPPQLMAVPENFNPGRRLPPPKPQPVEPPSQPPASTSTEFVTSAAELESLTTDFRQDENNFGQRNLFIEETAQFRLANGNRFRIRTGFNSFEQQDVESVTNIPLQVEWEGKIDRATVTVGGGIDIFDRLPTALNFNARVEAPIARKVSSSGQLQSLLVIAADIEQGPYKSNAETLDNQITAWRFGPSIYWQINPKTSLYSSLRLGSYNDGNFEQQSFSRLEHKIGQFSIAANVFNWNYTDDVQETSGYFSPPDFLVYNGEIAWEGNVFEDLRCRVAATLGQQRLRGEWDNANGYQARCTAKLSSTVEADLGYAFSNLRNQDTGESTSNSQSFTGQLRIRF